MPHWQEELKEWIKALLLAVVLAVALRTFVVDNYIVDGDSMLPTLHDQERVLVYKLGQKLGLKPQRGDIVVFQYAREPWRDFVKRVVGLEGDEVEIRDGKLFVNGIVQNEPYLSAPMLGSYGPQIVPAGTVFVLGDNRNISMDSRDPQVDMVRLDTIRGKAFIVYWPIKAIRLVQR
ncbi:MAG TPA: signal peptidase I [Firmicutes bacterium]|nr:signal peptidase I [Bacillota bacterium]